MCTGVTAALELALVSKDLTNMEKLDFVRRKVEFMQEFGDVGRYVIILHKSNRISSPHIFVLIIKKNSS